MWTLERFEVSATVGRPVEQVWAAHEDVRLLERISPPFPAVRVVDPPTRCAEGTRFTVHLEILPQAPGIDWLVEIVSWEAPRRFVDRQVRGPFTHWEHIHQFSPLTDDSTLIVESIRFEFNPLLDAALVRPALDWMFQWRMRNLVAALEG